MAYLWISLSYYNAHYYVPPRGWDGSILNVYNSKERLNIGKEKFKNVEMI